MKSTCSNTCTMCLFYFLSTLFCGDVERIHPLSCILLYAAKPNAGTETLHAELSELENNKSTCMCTGMLFSKQVYIETVSTRKLK